jgi:hypothetical protein
MKFQLLQVRDEGLTWGVYGITENSALPVTTEYLYLRASAGCIAAVKENLEQGNSITLPKVLQYEEAQVTELIIGVTSGLEKAKQAAIVELNSRLQASLLTMSVIDSIDFLDTYAILMDAGIFITDLNREDKYLEVIEASQIEKPEDVPDDATFEQEQERNKLMIQYDTAQRNLATLEKFLNARDKIMPINFMAGFIARMKTDLQAAETEEQIQDIMNVFTKTFS